MQSQFRLLVRQLAGKEFLWLSTASFMQDFVIERFLLDLIRNAGFWNLLLVYAFKT
jgi:hypothetical protein